MNEAGKQAAARAAIAEVRDGMTVGLGTGSTAAFAIATLGERVSAGLRVSTLATSAATARAAIAAGLQLVDMATLAEIDLAIDGVDEIDPAMRAIKGGGGAMLREKIVASAARRMIGVADASKHVPVLGRGPVPIEVLSYGAALVASRVAALGGEAKMRGLNGKLYRTDQDNVVLDCRFGEIADPEMLADRLSAIPGVLGHGLFLTEIDVLYVGEGDIVTCVERPASASAAATRTGD